MMKAKVYLVTRPAFDVDKYLTFVSDAQMSWKRSSSASEAEEIVESAGRVCYMSFGSHQSPRTNAQYIAHLVEMGHESVLEHVNWGFVFTGVSRAFSHQIVRHRPGWAFSQLSQQYHDENDASFVEPADLVKSPAAHSAWQKATSTARSAYHDIMNSLNKIEPGKTAEEVREVRRAIYSAARSVLPNATETKLFVTVNARAIRHFLSIRGAILGDEEMRRVSAAILVLLKSEAPSLFSDFEMEFLPDGSPRVLRTGNPGQIRSSD